MLALGLGLARMNRGASAPPVAPGAFTDAGSTSEQYDQIYAFWHVGDPWNVHHIEVEVGMESDLSDSESYTIPNGDVEDFGGGVKGWLLPITPVPGADYYIRVTAWANAGETVGTTWTDDIVGPITVPFQDPPSPFDFYYFDLQPGSDYDVELNWINNADADAYRVELDEVATMDSGPDGVPLYSDVADGADATYQFVGAATPPGNFYARVVAINGGGETVWTDDVVEIPV